MLMIFMMQKIATLIWKLSNKCLSTKLILESWRFFQILHLLDTLECKAKGNTLHILYWLVQFIDGVNEIINSMIASIVPLINLSNYLLDWAQHYSWPLRNRNTMQCWGEDEEATGILRWFMRVALRQIIPVIISDRRPLLSLTTPLFIALPFRGSEY